MVTNISIEAVAPHTCDETVCEIFEVCFEKEFRASQWENADAAQTEC